MMKKKKQFRQMIIKIILLRIHIIIHKKENNRSLKKFKIKQKLSMLINNK